MTPDEILGLIEEMTEDDEIDVLQYPDLKDALIGYAEPWDTSGNRPLRLVYSYKKCIECFMKDGMDYDEAREWMSFNVEGGYIGPHTPIIMYEGI